LTKLKVEGMNLTLEIKFRDHNAYCVFVREATMAGGLSPPPHTPLLEPYIIPFDKKSDVFKGFHFKILLYLFSYMLQIRYNKSYYSKSFLGRGINIQNTIKRDGREYQSIMLYLE
jgi:hypothetical protein